MAPVMTESDNVLDGLACVGLGPDDIDVVDAPHLHPDHCGCNGFFKRALLIVHARELEAARAGRRAQGYLSVEWDHPLPIVRSPAARRVRR
jgi:glyoxylase-like metal-dependent hydrolase (beta-lactamase superfamily II)